MKRLFSLLSTLFVAVPFLLSGCTSEPAPAPKPDANAAYNSSPAPQGSLEITGDNTKIDDSAAGNNKNAAISENNVQNNTASKSNVQVNGGGAENNKKPGERTVTFTLRGGKEIKTTVASGKETNAYVALFSPAVEPTDENFYAISLQLLNEFYGTNRGLILPENAKTQDLLAGKIICWEIENPSQKYCISRLKASDTDTAIAGVSVVVK